MRMPSSYLSVQKRLGSQSSLLCFTIAPYGISRVVVVRQSCEDPEFLPILSQVHIVALF